MGNINKDASVHFNICEKKYDNVIDLAYLDLNKTKSYDEGSN